MKTILVHLDSGEGSAQRLQLAISLARSFDATLTGLFAQIDSDEAAITARRASPQLRALAAQRQADFTSQTAAAGIKSEWLELPHGEPGFVISESVFCARYADLAVIGQWDADDGKVPEDFAERLVLDSGRPVLVIPHAGKMAAFGQKIGIAWNASREASRALHDSLPFLARAKEVTVLTIRPTESSTVIPGLPSLNVVKHLAQHGIAATGERVVEEDIGLMDSLLLQSHNHGFDLLVMGAHSGLGVIRGSGTRFMLRHMTLPVLMSC